MAAQVTTRSEPALVVLSGPGDAHSALPHNRLNAVKGLDSPRRAGILALRWVRGAYLRKCWICKSFAHVAQEVEHVLGKDEVTGSNPVVGLLFICYGSLKGPSC